LSKRNLKSNVLAGRVVGILDDGFVLQNEAGRYDIAYEGEVNVGDILEVEVSRATAEATAEGAGEILTGATSDDLRTSTSDGTSDVRVVVACEDDFFIRKGDPNFKKMVIDHQFLVRMKERAKIIEEAREFFKERDFLEVETPSLVKLPGMEPYLDVFKTRFEPEGHKEGGSVGAEDMYLITSPEYAMKKLLVGGAEKIFQICKSFRNKETGGPLHNPEFTLLEWYRAYADYEDIMKDTEELVCDLAVLVNGESVIRFQGREIDVSTPWPRMKVKEAFEKYAGIPVSDFEDLERMRAAVRGKGYKVSDEAPFDELFFVVFMNEIEPKLGLVESGKESDEVTRPVILYEYPASMAALSKKCADERYAQRFEAYIAGVELCNAFTELNDWSEQKKRLMAEREERKRLGKHDYAVDDSFVSALRFGMPPSGGNALGIDRLVMLLLDVPDIRDVLFFPHEDL
jgi:elongation factor P--(R)-beta-lysine ligase